MGRKQKLRRSQRQKVKGDYRRIVEASDPFPVSPDRKRKYDKEEGEGTLIEELIHVSENYVSDEDPDYVPGDEEEEDSEASEDDDDEADGDEEADDDGGQDESEARISDEQAVTSQASSQEPTQSKQTTTVNGVEEKEHGEKSTRKNDATPGQAAELTQDAKKAEAQITAAKNKAEKPESDDNSDKKNGVSKVEGRIVI